MWFDLSGRNLTIAGREKRKSTLRAEAVEAFRAGQALEPANGDWAKEVDKTRAPENARAFGTNYKW